MDPCFFARAAGCDEGTAIDLECSVGAGAGAGTRDMPFDLDWINPGPGAGTGAQDAPMPQARSSPGGGAGTGAQDAPRPQVWSSPGPGAGTGAQDAPIPQARSSPGAGAGTGAQDAPMPQAWSSPGPRTIWRPACGCDDRNPRPVSIRGGGDTGKSGGGRCRVVRMRNARGYCCRRRFQNANRCHFSRA
ncbi:hypothetical protein T492DRAFT_97529 [Pavlovales sp. CCMP2436]|nr:hypothetical protein T492DRAFT_97529 [Pavlovales sp. CCMP2436]